MSGTTRILGIDPGSRVTGFGVIDSDGRRSVHVAHGAIAAGSGELPERLGRIFSRVLEVVEVHRPAVLAIEDVFMARNAASALKLGQARGAAICAGVSGGLRVSEYSPREIKQAVVGTGAADKAQVQHMIRALLRLREPLPADAADALAVALCHAHTASSLARIGRAGGRS